LHLEHPSNLLMIKGIVDESFIVTRLRSKESK
jgi:hypothetical protein